MTDYSCDNDAIKEGVSKLLKIDASDHAKIHECLMDLKKKTNDEKITDAMYRCYVETLEGDMKVAEKIKKKMFAKYPNYGIEEYISKINAYQKKHKFSNDKKRRIIDMIFRDKKPFVHEYGKFMPYTEMSKTLGFKPQNYGYATGQMTVKSEDMPFLNDILTLNASTKNLHNQVKLQSFVYNIDTDLTQFIGVVNRITTDIYSSIHPVIFALYIPKFNFIEQRTIMASIPEIIAKLKEGRPLETIPEIDLYDDICRDPVDSICTKSESPYQSLLQRSKVQTLLWNEVLNLRQGKYYNSNIVTLMDALNTCVKHTYAPDFTYVRDCGTILRALYSAFSIRPINITAIPEVDAFNPIAMITPTQTVFTTIPMINVLIPPTGSIEADYKDSEDLSEYLRTKSRIRQSGRGLYMKMQVVQYCFDVLTFYVPRKEIKVNVRPHKPYSCIQIPITSTGFEELNNRRVSVFGDNGSETKTLTVGQEEFVFRSVVIIETISPKMLEGKQIIAGCGTIVRLDGAEGTTDSCWLYYSPLGLTSKGANSEIDGKNAVAPFHPLTYIDASDTPDLTELGRTNGLGLLKKYVEQQGTIYIFGSNEQKLDGCNRMSGFLG